jgi:hypothetical protein
MPNLAHRSSFSALFYRIRWFQCPAAALVALLQRTPVLRVVANLGDAFSGMGTGTAATALVRSATALAALGAIDTMAGATTLIASSPSPLAATTGTALSGVAFGVNGTQGPPESWTLNSTLPGGLTFGGLSGPGTVNVANPILQGTPTAAGTYNLDLVAWEFPGGPNDHNNVATPHFLYTIKVAQGVVPPTPPTITRAPSPQTIAVGSTAVFSVGATGSGTLSYQWSANGAAVGTNAPRLVVSNPTTVGTSTYTCVVSSSNGTSTSTSTTLTVQVSGAPGHLINESVLTSVPAGGSLTVGFVTSAASERLLIRGVGPSLGTLGLAGYVPDPSIKVFASTDSTTPFASNDNWGSDAGNINAADSATGAFALSAGSLDAALVTTPQVPGNSVVYTPNTAGGQGLAEIYDYSAAAYTVSSPRITNLSTIFNVAAGSTFAAGFVVGGSTSKTFLIRAMGPTVGKAFGIPGTMTDPSLTLVYQSGGGVIASNTNWAGDPQLNAVANQVTGLPFAAPALADSAVLVTLAPGNYTAMASSASGSAGTVLIEVYEVP